MARPLPLQRSGPTIERRDERRVSFPRLRQMRPVTDDPEKPGRATWVRYHDLGPRGISFWSTTPPETDWVLLSIEENEPRQLVAEIRHRTQLGCTREPLYLVGCRVLGTYE